jgi:nucleotide-binding universal stress UspA family protein/GNAT superfamily N-acetyltransferase
MFEKILLPTDFSEYAQKTLESVSQIPGVREVVLLHVLDTSRLSSRLGIFTGHEEVLQEARAQLHQQKTNLKQYGLHVKVILKVIEDGDFKRAILHAAEEEAVSLIVMGARGKGIISELLLGSVSASVLEYAKTNILLTRYRGSQKEDRFCELLLSKVIWPVDFSKPSHEMMAFLQYLPGISEITLLHVIRSAESREELEFIQERAMKRLERMGQGLVERGMKVNCMVRSGYPSEQISALADEIDASLILMSRFGQKDYMKNIHLGSTTANVAKNANRPLFVRYPQIQLNIRGRELHREEFHLAEEVWQDYHQQKGDTTTDRIFGIFVESTLVAVARCRRHPDGLEVDGVYVLNEFRNRGYARQVVEHLVAGCGHEPLYMHSTLELVGFYGTFGFQPIDEKELPPTIRERFSFAMGEMEGANVQPMRRPASPPKPE